MGASFDLAATLRLCDELGVCVALDLTQSLGVVPYCFGALSRTLRLLAACSVHKHLYGMHGTSLVFVSPALLAARGDVPALEPHAHQLAAAAVADWDARDGMTAAGYAAERAPGARRWDAGHSNGLGWAVLAASLRLVLREREDCQQRLAALSGEARRRLAALPGVATVGEAPHFFSLRCERAPELHAHLRARRVYVDLRHGGLRVAFGLYNSAVDVDTLVEVVAQWLAQ